MIGSQGTVQLAVVSVTVTPKRPLLTESFRSVIVAEVVEFTTPENSVG
jgi:hypothetical protein